MSGGYSNAATDSPGKRNTRSKYSSFVNVQPSFVQSVHVGAHAVYDGGHAVYDGPVLRHLHGGGFSNLSHDSPGKYSSRVKYSSILSRGFHSVAPAIYSSAARSVAPVVISQQGGGFSNLSYDSPGKYSSYS